MLSFQTSDNVSRYSFFQTSLDHEQQNHIISSNNNLAFYHSPFKTINVSTSNFTAPLYQYPRHHQDTHTTGPNQLNRSTYRYITTQQTYLYCRNKMKNKKIQYCRNKKKYKKNTTLSEQNEKQKILHCRNKMKNKKYHTVWPKWKTKNTTLPNKMKNKKYYTVGTKWKTKNTNFVPTV
jgi:hypothetical protein